MPVNDEGWGPSTAVYGGGGNGARRGGRASTAPPAPRAARPQSGGRAARDEFRDDGWDRPGPLPRGAREPARAGARRDEARGRGVPVARAPERGLPWWAALGLLVAIAALGGVIDTVGSIQVQGGFNIGIVVASVVAILAVKRSHMFPIVIAPPIVYSLAAVFQLYLKGGPHDKKALLDAAANYLVYGFPAIAAASAAVLIIAGIRMISRK